MVRVLLFSLAGLELELLTVPELGTATAVAPNELDWADGLRGVQLVKLGWFKVVGAALSKWWREELLYYIFHADFSIEATACKTLEFFHE